MTDDVMNYGVQVTLADPEDFLKIKETLSRIGVPSNRDKVLYQSCHLLHKRGNYYIIHFKELFKLDGRESTFSDEDEERRNLIASLLHDWGLLKVNNVDLITNKAPMSSVKVISFKDKDMWDLQSKYRIGVKK